MSFNWSHSRKLPLALLALIAAPALYSCANAPAGDTPLVAAAADGLTPGAEAPATEPEPEPAADEAAFKFEKPEHVKGIYLTAWSAASSKKMDNMLALIERTELNAVVIDVRDSGNMYWQTDIELAKASPPTQIAIKDHTNLFRRLEEAKVYPIARISCFRDSWVPKKHPELAIQTPEGGVWKDRGGHMWLDPYNKRNWDYIAEVVVFAMDAGFPEIQMDYIRFPSEGKVSSQRFPAKKDYPDPDAKPEDVIKAFAEHVGEKVRARNRVYSADIFGIISSNSTDEGIGQALEKIAAPFDLLCPMVYPSHYAKGEYGIKNPNAEPYAIILKSLGDFKRRLPNKPLRPWLQDFSLGHKYGPAEVRAQIKAARELGYNEFLLWNARNVYTEGALAKAEAPKRDAE
jgi:hypothetical protein